MDSTQWQSFLKSCLDILRNGESKFDGLKAINEFITLITLKLIENRICDKNNDVIDENINIPIGVDCKMTNIYNNYCTIEKMKIKTSANDLYDIMYNKFRIFDIIQEFDDDMNVISETRTRNSNEECIIIRFNSITDNLNRATKNTNDSKTLTSFDKTHSKDIQLIIKKIHETFQNTNIDDFDYDAFGDAYEKMIADELGNSSKRYGQYFTKRDLISLIINELNIKSTDKCYDPSCGTGGFILGFSKKFKTDKNFIENNIHGNEILEEVHKTMAFNMLAYNIDGCIGNISNTDSITLQHHQKTLKQFDVVGANPPFGMSINCEIKDFPIIVKDSVALFLQHIYFSLKDSGRAGIVIDRGILNNGVDKKNSWEKRLRKFLIEHTSINKIINLPTGIFKHTNFATSVIFFTKGQPTTNIKYIEGYFDASDKGKGEKTLLLGEEKIINIKQIKEKNYSLKYDDYFKIQETMTNDNKWIKLGEVCEIKYGTRITKSKNGKSEKDSDVYPVYGGGDITFYTDKFNREGQTIILSRFGVSLKCVRVINGKIFLNDSAMSINTKTNVLINFIKYYLLFNQSCIYKNFTAGQAQLNIETNKLLNEFLIPNLSIQHQEEIVQFLDEIYQKYRIEDTIKYMKDSKIFNLLIEKNYDGFNRIMFYQENIPILINELENIPIKKNNYIQSLFKTVNGKMMRLGDLVEIKKGKAFNTSEMVNGDYKVIGGGFIPMKEYTHNEYNTEENEILISNDGAYAGYLNRFDEKMFITGHCNKIIPNKQIYNDYLYYYLKSNQDFIIKNYQKGQAQPSLDKHKLLEFKIPLPSLQSQLDIIEKINKLNEPLSHYESYTKILNEELLNIRLTINNLTKLETTVESDSVIESDTNNEILVETIKQEQSTDNEIIKEITKTKKKINKQKQQIDGNIIKVKKLTKTKT